MSNCAIVGINWGDEGKGRMVDLIARDYDIVCRYQGGNNAGHTIVNEYGKFALHLIPSGICLPGVVNVLGNGVVIDLESLCGEIEALQNAGVPVTPENFKISERATIHGKMKPKEKDAVMRAFAAHEIDVLVSTTVIEVGVDVPNAALMLIENAECFGLSQLHQLRGRVGRGRHKSYCVLVSDNKGEENKQRLKVMSSTSDGFAIAEEDLKLRGPGDFFGSRQHGLPSLRVADLSCDLSLLHETQSAAGQLLAADPALKNHPLLKARVELLFELNADAMN